MQLNHLNLCVRNLAEARAFFQDHLDFQFLEQKGEAVAVLSDGYGFTLVLSNQQAFGHPEQPYPEGFHVGFIQESSAQVDQMYQRLAATSVQIGHEPRKMRGSYGFYFTALNDVLFEISCPL